MVRRYEVVLDGIDVSDEEDAELERTIQGVVRDFLASRQDYGGSAAGQLEMITDPEELRARFSEVPPGGRTGGIWAGPELRQA
ncbi:MAG TPA: hypothetical protein VGW75_05620 [Solirubrobacteraceae bacterium]|jgi:hypothetical protein|nr:hypothetical protein [Solirubrobacteraceae bacterium]